MILVILLKKQTTILKLLILKNKQNNHNHDKCIDTSKFNALVANVFNARLAQANLITKTDFNTKLSSFNRKITQNISKHLLVQNELNKLKLLILVISLEKVILKKMVHKII